MAWIGAAIAAGASLLGGAMSSRGASSAADASARGSQAAIDEQARQFDILMGQSQPYQTTGVGANNTLAQLFGLPYQTGTAAPQSRQVTNALTGISGGSPGRTFNGTSLLAAGAGGAIGGLAGTLLGGSMFGGRQTPRYSWDANRGVVNVDGQAGKYAGGYIDPNTGEAVVYTPGTSNPDAELSALATNYLRTGEGQLPDVLLRFGNATGAVRQTGWQYDPAMTSTAQGGTGGVTTPTGPDYSKFYTSPGYQFRFNEGLRGVERSAAARSGVLNGNTLRGISNYGQNTASDEFGNYVNTMLTLSGRGQTSNQTAAGVGQNYANNVSGLRQDQGNYRASGITNRYDAYGNVINDIGNGLGDWWTRRQQSAGSGARTPANVYIPGGY